MIPRRVNRNNSRRGSAYLLVLAATTIVTAAGVGALLVQRASNRATQLAHDTAAARAGVQSGLELGAWVIHTVPTWRSTFGQGTWIPGWTIGDATVTVYADTADGSSWQSSTDSTQRITITAVATVGDATQVSTMDVYPETLPDTPLPLLDYSAVAGNRIEVESSEQLSAPAAPVASNNAIWVDGTLVADAESVINGGSGSITGSTTLLDPALTIPTSSVFASYVARGTELTGVTRLHDKLLTRGWNPYGFPNSRGIYVIRAGSDVSIQRLRLEGTLIVIAPGRTVTISDAALLEPADDGTPTLLVEGNLRIDLDRNTKLNERDTGNLNPFGSPYEGAWDLDAKDRYPSLIRGLVHATEVIEITDNAAIEGLLIANDTLLAKSDDAQLIHDPAFAATPPEGYYTPGTTRWLADLDSIQRLARE